MSDVKKMRVKIEKIGETQVFGANGFRKRELVGVVSEGEHVQKQQFEFVQDKVDLLDALIEDTYVTIFYNIRCREFIKDGQEPKYFTSLSGWKVEV